MDIDAANTLITKTCIDFKFEMNPTMWLYSIPLLIDGDNIITEIPDANHNALDPQVAYETANNVVNDTYGIENKHVLELVNSMTAFTMYLNKVGKYFKHL